MADNKVITSTVKGIPSFEGKFQTPDLSRVKRRINEDFAQIGKEARRFRNESAELLKTLKELEGNK